MLSLCGEVISRKWNVVMDIVEEIKNENTIILEKEWNDEYKNDSPDIYPLDLSDIHTWSTYDKKCIELSFTADNDSRLICDVRIYDGFMLDGRRIDLRFTAKIVLPNDFILKIQDIIEYGFEEFLEDQYQNQLELEKLQWKTNLKKTILNKK